MIEKIISKKKKEEEERKGEDQEGKVGASCCSRALQRKMK